MNKENIKKFNITILEIYYILMLIFKLLNYKIVFSNQVLGWFCIISIHLIIVYISYKKINDKELNRILILGLIFYRVNSIKYTNVFFNFMLLITIILLYYTRKSKNVTKNRKKFILFNKNSCITFW